MKKPELLSPAGNFEKLKIALEYGADAVYCSYKKFGLRNFAENFTEEELEKAIKFVHNKNKKIYITVNIFPYNNEIKEIKEFLYFLNDVKPDGVIISDLGVFSLAKNILEDIPIYISVQANTLNYETVKFWKNLGASRIILSRELSFDDIKLIREKVKDIELEIFIHGAMCMSLSGRCLISNYLTGRDANKGECAQCCRWSYHLVEEKRKGEFFPVVEDERGTYIFNSKDLCIAEHLHKFIEIGIDSFKIEGRIKGLNYVAVTTAVYKKIIDEFLKNKKNYRFNYNYLKELETISHREYTTGFYFPDNKLKQNFKTSKYIATKKFLGIIEEVEDHLLKVKVKNTFKIGDEVEIFTPDMEVFKIKITNLFNEEKIEETYAKQEKNYYIKNLFGNIIKKYSLLRK